MDIRSPDIRSHGKNVPGDQTSYGQNVPLTKLPRDKMSYTNYQVFKNRFGRVRKLATYVCTSMLGNGPHPCTQFMYRVPSFFGEVRLDHSLILAIVD